MHYEKYRNWIKLVFCGFFENALYFLNLWAQFESILKPMNFCEICRNGFFLKRKRCATTTAWLDFFRDEIVFSFCTRDLCPVEQRNSFWHNPKSNTLKIFRLHSLIWKRSWRKRNLRPSTASMNYINIHFCDSLSEKIRATMSIEAYEHKILITPSYQKMGRVKPIISSCLWAFTDSIYSYLFPIIIHTSYGKSSSQKKGFSSIYTEHLDTNRYW